MYYPASRYVFHIQPLHNNSFQFLCCANSKNLVSLNFSGAVLAFIWSFWGCREEVLQNDDEYDSYLRPGLGVGRTLPFGPKNACACKLVAASRALTHELRVPGRNATTMIVDDDRRRRHSDIDLFMSSNSLSQLVFQQIPT